MTRHLSEIEIRAMLARLARQAPDDVDGYVVVLAKGADVLCTVSNAASLGTQIMLLGRAIEHRGADVSAIEQRGAHG
jgi:hypothetical protein